MFWGKNKYYFDVNVVYYTDFSQNFLKSCGRQK